MRKPALFCFLLAATLLKAQSADSLIFRAQSILKNLMPGDSAIYYQCHVEDAGIQLTTASGQTLTGKSNKCSITEKYVLIKKTQGFFVRYYSSSLTELPNRKFSALKMREKPYWNFTLLREFELTTTQLKVLLALERKGHEAIEYDYVISKNNNNQVIIRHKKDFKQLVIEGNYVISKLILN